ncbi:MAG: hypothetical protein M1825_002730 [Sarcosagium campestre]|nr:MAG: hypothetical protein M1825_002730 [Sarcosagium campestre]
MSLFPSFLTDLQPNATRQAPSPHQQQQALQNHHQTNGNMTAPAVPGTNGHPLGGAGVNVFPTAAGHQMDLNHLWQQVQELSGLLAQNRESTRGIVRSVDEVRNRALRNGGMDMGEIAGALDGQVNGVSPPRSAEELQAHVQALTESNATLEGENAELSTLLETYEASLARVLDQVRVYAHDHTLATLAIHKSYTQQLAAERLTNVELRQDYGELQARLGVLAATVREGLKWEDDGIREVESWAELSNENRALRRALGLPIEPDGSDGLSDPGREGTRLG